MTSLQIKVRSDTWASATWDEYAQIIESPNYEKAKGYYHDNKMRIEMSPVGSDHSRDHVIVLVAVSLFAGIKGINLNGMDNCTYRKTGSQDCQPDVSYYIGENADIIPWGTSIINLETYPAPDLVIEVANTSLADDKGEKRLLYEDIGVAEYWIVDVQNIQIIAFAIANRGSKRIEQSNVLPNLQLSLLEEALQQTRQANQSQVCAWLLKQFQ